MLTEEEQKALVDKILEQGARFVGGACPNCGGKNRNALGNSFDGRVLEYAEVCSDCHFACVQVEAVKEFIPLLHIITPCSRPQNLIRIAESIPQQIAVKWHIIQDIQRAPRVQNLEELKAVVPNTVLYEYDQPVFSLGEMKNLVLKQLSPREEDWVYILDDDNLMHPNFLKTFRQAFYKTSCSGFIVGCDVEDDLEFKASPNNLGMGKIDMAQACFSTTILEDNLFPEWGKEEDNIWINKVIFSRPHKIIFFNEIVASYHDGLRRGK